MTFMESWDKTRQVRHDLHKELQILSRSNDRALSHIFRFFENSKFFFEFFFLKIKLLLIISQNFKTLKIPDSSLIAPFIINLPLKTSSGSISSAVRVATFPVNPYFWLKPGKHDVTLTSFVVDISEVSSFPFDRMCQIDGLDGIENLVIIRL